MRSPAAFTLNLSNVPVAAVDRAAGTVLTLDGQHLPITGWADRDGVLDADPADAPICTAGPDAHDKHWTVDVARRTAKVRLFEAAR